MSQINVLLVDDEQELRRSLASIISSSLPDLQCAFTEAENGKVAVEKINSSKFDFVLMDVRMPEMDGLEALKVIKELDPSTFVVIMTAHANLQDAVEAIKLGAFDYTEKPIDPKKLAGLMERAVETREIVSSLAVSSPIMDEDIDTEFVGASEKMRSVFGLINKLSQVDTTVLIRGENGTGKELVAKGIHFNSPRKHGEFVAINCGAIPEELIESELFGHEKGSFTGAHERKIGKFQQANNGTIFLDEIAEMRPDMQVKLLRVLQERKFVPIGGTREIKTNARIVAATNRNLEKMIEDGSFREDFFYRLNVMPIFMPPLRDRIDDLNGLVSFFIKKFNKKQDRAISGISAEALSALKQHSWPGNIRELENAIERSFIIESGTVISVGSLPDNIRDNDTDNVSISFPQNYIGPMDFDKFKESTEKEFIENALKANRGKINKTVAQANIPKNTLLRKIKKYAIDVKKLGEDS